MYFYFLFKIVVCPKSQLENNCASPEASNPFSTSRKRRNVDNLGIQSAKIAINIVEPKCSEDEELVIENNIKLCFKIKLVEEDFIRNNLDEIESLKIAKNSFHLKFNPLFIYLCIFLIYIIYNIYIRNIK
jgi:hypothetical protein